MYMHLKLRDRRSWKYKLTIQVTYDHSNIAAYDAHYKYRSLNTNLITDHVSALDTNALKKQPALGYIGGNRKSSAPSQSQSQDGEGNCVICLDKKASFALIPCGHLSLCIQCKRSRLQDLQHTCPLCRSTFRDAMRVFGVPST